MKIPEILLVESEQKPGSLAKILQVIGEAGLLVEHLNSVRREQGKTLWEITLEMDEETDRGLYDRIDALPNAKLLGKSDRVFNRHRGGKIHTVSKESISSLQILRDIYTPGVARVCLAIRDNPDLARTYTSIGDTVAIVTNGTAILGLGNIGPLAGLPVMEGKSALFATFANITGVPILIEEQDPDRVIDAVTAIAPSFGAIQLEDIAAPECFYIEKELMKRLDKPVLHDDQHGTAVVALAAMMNVARRVGCDLKTSIVGQIGLGSAGLGIAQLLKAEGLERLIGADLDAQAVERFEAIGGEPATMEKVMSEAEIVVATTGVKDLIKPELVRKGQVILALSNPDPEIEPLLALEHGAAFAADGKAINNVLGFPGLFRGALDAGAPRFTKNMLFAASRTLTELTEGNDLVPDVLNKGVHDSVAAAVREQAQKEFG